jgi:hypothetical protein
MTSIRIVPGPVARVTFSFLAFWIIFSVISVGFSLFSPVRKAELLVIGIISLIAAICWTLWHRLTIENHVVSIRYTRYGLPLACVLAPSEIRSAKLQIQGLWPLPTNGRPEVSLELTEADARVRLIFLGLYLPSQGRRFAQALADIGVAVEYDCAPNAR